MPYKVTENDIQIHGTDVWVKEMGKVAMWWRHYDKRVSVDYSIRFLAGTDGKAESFIANTEDEVKAGLLKIVNNEH